MHTYYPSAVRARGDEFFYELSNGQVHSAAKPQPNGVRPSSGAETSDGDKCESNPEPQSSLKLLRPGTEAQDCFHTCRRPTFLRPRTGALRLVAAWPRCASAFDPDSLFQLHGFG